MCRLIDEAVVTARKRHGCSACLGTIAVEQPYLRQRVADGDDAWTWKAHTVCVAAIRQLEREHGVTFECEDSPDPFEVREVVGGALAVALLVSVGEGE